jgi:hypothetical protein
MSDTITGTKSNYNTSCKNRQTIRYNVKQGIRYSIRYNVQHSTAELPGTISVALSGAIPDTKGM